MTKNKKRSFTLQKSPKKPTKFNPSRHKKRTILAAILVFAIIGGVIALVSTKAATATVYTTTGCSDGKIKTTQGCQVLTCPRPLASDDQRRVVGTGDSILYYGTDYLSSRDRWLTLEPGRQINSKGIFNRSAATAKDSYSHQEIWPEVLRRSCANGWVVFQENALGSADNTSGTTDEEFQAFVRKIVTDLPDDRCLAVVTPYFLWSVNKDYHANAMRKTKIMIEEAYKQPCAAIIRWDLEAANNHALIKAVDEQGRTDGQHPTEAGRKRLGELITKAVGARN